MDKMNISDTNYCRLCLKKDKNVQNFIKVTDSQIYDRILQIFYLELEDKHFSQLICLQCRDRVQDITDYINNVQKNQEVLKKVTFKEEIEVHEVLISEKTVKKRARKKISSDEKLFCDICGHSFIAKSSLITHMKKYHLQELNETRSGAIVRYYDRLVDISKYLFCELCEDNPHFETFDDLSEHYQAMHEVRGYVKCCNSTFHTKRSVVVHTDRHLRPTDYMCSICNKFLPNKSTLRDHMDRHKPDEEKTFVCNICQKRFSRQYHLDYHIKQVHKKPPTDKVNCVQCGKMLANQYVLQQHMKRNHLHMAKKPFICESCGKGFFSKKDMMSHFSFKHTEERSKCPICGVVIKCIRRHMRMHQELQKDINCEICGKKVTTTSALKSHMKMHDSIKPFTCEICDKSFIRKTALTDHMSQHDGIPRHFCHFCDRTFNNSGNKAKHIKQMHAEEQKKRLETQRLKKEKIFNEISTKIDSKV